MTFNLMLSHILLSRRAFAIKLISAALAFTCLIVSQMTFAQISLAQTYAAAGSDHAPLQVHASKTPLEDKLYRQALYFYFAGDYASALRQISLNDQRHTITSPRSDLFEAGMQVNIGLHRQATETLLSIEHDQADINRTNSNSNSSSSSSSSHDEDAKSTSSPTELLLIALLQLSEQQIEQGDNQAAQHTLARINSASMHKAQPEYVEQYQVLSQLAYWPYAPEMTVNLNDAANSEPRINSLPSAYIALNKALHYMDQKEFLLAQPILSELKTKAWQSEQLSFWQLLFNPFSRNSQALFDSEGKPIKDTVLQQQAVNDYATLLLAQMYVMQQQYEAAFNELANFPEHSPYSESALYLFAFAAQNAGHYDTAFNLLDALQQRYPYSHLGWQAALLSAAQVTQQQSLAQGMAYYQQAEQLYLNQIADLALFKQTFLSTSDVASFVKLTKRDEQALAPSIELLTHTPFTTQSKWLQKALLDARLATDFQAVLTLDLLDKNLSQQQTKSDWLKQTLVLNKLRQNRVIETQKQTSYGALIEQLTKQKMRITQIISDAQTHQDGQVFASQTEQQWLQRIKESKQAIANLSPKRNTESYQKRLDKVSAVLQWQLQRDFAARLWQHKKSLQQLDSQLALLEAQSERFNALSSSQPVYADFDIRQQSNETEIKKLAVNISQLRVKASLNINQKVTVFVTKQQQELNKLLLSTRHAMAAVLEQMAQADAVPASGAQ
jgi:exonuclease SbcC